MARSVQEILIPQNGVQELSGFRIASSCCPEMAVGGDFYDIWEIAPNRLGVFISDVMGHGVSAAFVTVFIKTILAEFQQQIEDNPGYLLEILNTRFNDLISSRLFMFATAFCGIIDVEKGELVCANAGHAFPLLYSSDQQTYAAIGDKYAGNGLGIWQESSYETMRYPLTGRVGYCSIQTAFMKRRTQMVRSLLPNASKNWRVRVRSSRLHI